MPLSAGRDATITEVYDILGGNKIPGDDPELQASAQKELLDMATRLVDSIILLVQNGTVTTPTGVPVATAGSATNQVGATTAPGIGTIS